MADSSDMSMSIGVPGLRVNLGPRSLVAVGRVFRREIFRDPCLIIDRWSGLALDSTTDPHVGTKPVLWTVHSEPWQRWRLRRAGRTHVYIQSVHCGLVLTATSSPANWAEVRLDTWRGADEQRWRVHQSVDGFAFQLSAGNSNFMLDSGDKAKVPAGTEERWVGDPDSPHLWENWGGRCQEWSIARL